MEHEHEAENGHDQVEIKVTFLDEQIFFILAVVVNDVNAQFQYVKNRGRKVRPWYVDIANYLLVRQIPPNLLFNRKGNLSMMQVSVFGKKKSKQLSLWVVNESPYGGHFSGKKTAFKVLQIGFFWPTLFKDADLWYKACDRCQ